MRDGKIIGNGELGEAKRMMMFEVGLLKKVRMICFIGTKRVEIRSLGIHQDKLLNRSKQIGHGNQLNTARSACTLSALYDVHRHTSYLPYIHTNTVESSADNLFSR